MNSNMLTTQPWPVNFLHTQYMAFIGDNFHQVSKSYASVNIETVQLVDDAAASTDPRELLFSSHGILLLLH